MNSIILQLSRRNRNSAFFQEFLKTLLDSGQTVAVCHSQGIEVHKKRGHLVSISTVPYTISGKKATSVVLEECSAKP